MPRSDSGLQAGSSLISAESMISMHPLTLMAAGHRVMYVLSASRASSVFPGGTESVYATRIRVILRTPSTSSMSPSTSAR